MFLPYNGAISDRDKTQVNHLLLELANALQSATDLKHALQIIYEAMLPEAPSSLRIGQIINDEKHGEHLAIYSEDLHDGIQSLHDMPVEALQHPALLSSVTHNQSIVVEDVANNTDLDPVVRRQILETGTHAWVMLPLQTPGELPAVLSIGWAHPKLFDAPSRYLCSQLSPIIAPVLQIHILRAKVHFLERQLVRAEAHASQLDSFAYMVAHELRNNIGQINTNAYMLEQFVQVLEPDEVQYRLRNITRAGYHMDNTLTALWMLAHIHHTDEIILTAVDMAAVVEAVLNELHQEIQARDAQVVFDTPMQDWPTVEAYTPWLERIWVNLIGNAVKYGGHPPVIKIGATTTADDAGRLCFYVCDNGKGVPVAERDQIFEPFKQLNPRSAGVGLGLAISQHIITFMRGEIAVADAPGGGACFTFSLPVIDG